MAGTDNVVEVLLGSYGAAARSAVLMSGGYAATCYDVRSTTGRYVLKVWQPGTQPHASSIRLVEALHRAGIPVACPIRTVTGEHVGTGHLGTVCLLPYITGATPPNWPQWPPRTLQRLGHTLGQVHSLDTTGIDPPLPRDDLDTSFDA